MNNANEVPENAIVLNNLVCNPLSLLNGFWSSGQGHEVAFDDVLSVGIIQPQGSRTRKVVDSEGIIAVGKTAG